MKHWSRPPAPNIVLSLIMTAIAIIFLVGIIMLLTEPTIKYGP